MSHEYRNALLSKLYEFQYGTGNTIEDIGGDYPIYGSNGIVGYTNKFNSKDAPVIGHIGAYAGIVNWADGKHFVTYNGVICRIKPNINPKYGYYCLLNSNLQSRLRGSTQPFVSYDLLCEVKVYLPDINTQNKIAKVLSDLDAKIKLNNKINQELEAMVKLIYNYWFVQFDFPDENGKPYKSSGGKMVYNEELRRKIPEGWEVKELSSISSFISRGISPKYLEIGGVYVINQKCIRNRTVLYTEARRHDNNARNAKNKKVKLYDILVNSTGVGTLGRVSIVKRLKESFITVDSHVTIVRANTDLINKFYFGYSLLSKQKEIERFSLGSTGQVELSKSQLESIKMLIPPVELQNKLQVNYNASLKKMSMYELENEQLEELRNWLLPMLMNGQVTVKEAEDKVGELNMAAEAEEKYNVKE